MLFLVVILSGIGDIPCHSTPSQLRRVAPLTSEYNAFVNAKTVATAVPEKPADRYRFHNLNAEAAHDLRRGRRSLVTAATSPISTLNLTGVDDPHHKWAAGVAWKFMALLFIADEDRVDISVETVSGTIHTSDTTILLGTANMGTRTITLYVDNIPNADALVLVLIHEMLHLLGFGTLSSPGATSFQSRANPITLEYASPVMELCVAEKHGYHGDSTLHTDATRGHWNVSSPQFDSRDIMMPIISFAKSGISICTTRNVLESRPRWTDTLCFTDLDCQLTAGAVCTNIGRHWISVCQARRHTQPTPVLATPSETTFLVFSFGAVLSVFWVLADECRRLTNRLEPLGSPLRLHQEYPWKDTVVGKVFASQ
jgi:hypothetical protein